MNKLKQILEFIRALLGFLLNLKKKKTDEKNEKPARPIPGKLPDDVPDDTPSDSIGIVSGRPRDNGPVGGPFRGGAGMYRSPLDTLGVGTSLLLRGMGTDCIRDGDVFMGSLNGC